MFEYMYSKILGNVLFFPLVVQKKVKPAVVAGSTDVSETGS